MIVKLAGPLNARAFPEITGACTFRPGDRHASGEPESADRPRSILSLVVELVEATFPQSRVSCRVAPLCAARFAAYPRRKLGSVRNVPRGSRSACTTITRTILEIRDKLGKTDPASLGRIRYRAILPDPAELPGARYAIREISRRPESSARGLMGNPRHPGREKRAASFRAPDKSSANID